MDENFYTFLFITKNRLGRSLYEMRFKMFETGEIGVILFRVTLNVEKTKR